MYCFNCGVKEGYDYIYPIDQSLQETWELNTSLTGIFNIREGSICRGCGVNARAQGLAKAIVRSKFGYGAANLQEWVRSANENKLKVCELNSCHNLHKTLSGLKNLTYSEYGTSSEEDIENLSYAKNSFDIVLHSETLEHVSDPSQAMKECRRVINSDGVVLLTIPIIWNRKTRQRAKIEEGRIVKLLPASHHGYKTDDYLVYFEYGQDIDKKIGVNVVLSDWKRQNYVFSSSKEPSKISRISKYKFCKLENIALAIIRSRTWAKKLN
ncbi:MAG: class I SAM-dependent methyltransferase [Candidatus Saccharimonadales bacterium]